MIPADASTRQIALIALGVLGLVLFLPATTTDSAPIELLVGDLPVVALYSIGLFSLTLVGIGYIITRHRPGAD